MKYAIIGLLAFATLGHSASTLVGRVVGCENIVCPDIDCEFGPQFNSSLSCSHFCQCTSGQPVLKECPDGLHYNALINECDIPAAAGCSWSSETEAPPPNGCEIVRCPPLNGEFALHLPNPLDCGSFCKCDWGKPVYFKCPDGLHFNAEKQVCDWPAAAGCEGPVVTNPTSKPTTPNGNSTTPNGNPTTKPTTTTVAGDDPPAPPTGCENARCPPNNVGNATHLPNPNDCGSFCKCDWGQGVYFKCPPGLHFNAEKEICDWPSQAGCEGSVGPSSPKPTAGVPTVRPTTTTPTTKPTSTTQFGDEPGSEPTESSTAAPPNGCEIVRCPPLNGEFALHLPNPLDCGSFCKCDWGKPVYFKCPDGLHFNAEKQVCDWPAAAGCEGPVVTNPTSKPTTPNGNPTTPNGNSTTPNGNPTTKPTTTTVAGDDPPAPPTGCENARCPPNNVGNATHLPNPNDCGSFCKCDWGQGVYFKCPPGLHFNAEKEICDWPSQAGCEGSVGPSSPKPTAGVPTVRPTTTTPTTKPTSTTQFGDEPGSEPTESSTAAPPNGCEIVRCPPLNGEFALHLPNPLDCGSFCKCDWGKPVYFKCPDGLHFNAEKQVCDWPAAAGCEGPVVTNPTSKPTTPNGNPTTPNGNSTTPNGNPTTKPTTTTVAGDDPPAPPTGCENARCPPNNVGNATHLPNPNDCGSFCKCDWGQGVYFKCPPGLHFNAEKEICDWPSQAGCEGSVGPSSPKPTAGVPTVRPTTTTPTTKPTSTTQFGDEPGSEPTESSTAAPPNGCEIVRCPPLNGEFALHLPNPLDCGSFCKCDWGKPVYFKCPDGLHFNAEKQVCDWPAAAGCEGPVVTNPTSKPTTPNGNSTTPNGNPTTKPTTTTVAGDDPPAPPTGCENARCPPNNVGNATHLPNPNDCGSFCKCDWGQGVYFKCPPGLHFNAEKEICDWPSQAGCEGSVGPSSPKPTAGVPTVRPTTTTPTTKPTSTTQFGDEPGSEPTESSTAAPPNGCEIVRCPPLNGEFALHLPNPLDCGSFCKCDWGKPVYFKCPDGLHFNAEKQVCDWPAAAGCEGPVVTNPTSKPTTTTVTANDETPNPPETTEAPEPTGCEFVRCPSLNGEFALHLANPLECESFCKCDWGVAIYFKCPDGLHFNKQKQVCDWPEAAKCEISSQLVGQVEEINLSRADEPTGCEVVRCPPLNGQDLLNIANPLDCGSYCRCDWGTPVYMKCPDGLHFNKETQICEWPQSAGCSLKQSRTFQLGRILNNIFDE